MKQLVSLGLVLVAACVTPAATPAVTPATTTVPPGPNGSHGSDAPRPTGPRPIHKGEQLEAVLFLGEKHIYTIELAASERVHFTIEGDAGPIGQGTGCGNWRWAWYAPSDAWVNGNPLPLAPNADGSGLRTAPVELAAEVAGAGDMVGAGGLWKLEVEADAANCPRMPYRVRAE